MSLPLKAVDRLFDRLSATFGSEWVYKWQGLDMAAVKTMWAYELSAFAENLSAIGWALEHLPGKCPNLIEFKMLCKQAPAPATLMLDAPKAPAHVVDKELARIAAEAFKKPTDQNGKVDHTRWIRRLEERKAKGEKLNMYQTDSIRRAKINLGWITE